MHPRLARLVPCVYSPTLRSLQLKVVWLSRLDHSMSKRYLDRQNIYHRESDNQQSTYRPSIDQLAVLKLNQKPDASKRRHDSRTDTALPLQYLPFYVATVVSHLKESLIHFYNCVPLSYWKWRRWKKDLKMGTMRSGSLPGLLAKNAYSLHSRGKSSVGFCIISFEL